MNKNTGSSNLSNHHRVLGEDEPPKSPTTPPAAEGSEDSAHMGADESQMVHEKPPTQALDDLLKGDDKKDKQSSNDELTPG